MLKSAETNGILLRRSTNCPWLLGLEFGLLPTLLGKGTMSVACNNLTFNALAKSYFQIVQNAECLGLRNKVQWATAFYFLHSKCGTVISTQTSYPKPKCKAAFTFYDGLN